MNPDQDEKLLSRQAVTASDLEGVSQPDVNSRPSTKSTPPSFMEDREKSDEQAFRDIADPVGIKAKFLTAVIDKDQDHDDSSSMRSFSSQEDLLDNELYEVESAFESSDELPEPPESELTEVTTADHCSEIPEITVDSTPIDNGGELTTESHDIEPGDQVEASPQNETLIDIDYDADNESGDEIDTTVVATQGACVADTIETVGIVHPNEELNQAVAETFDEVLKVIDEQVPHTNLPPEAIVNEVEATPVAEPDGASSIIMVSGKDWYLLTEDNGTSLKVVQTNEDGTSKMVLQNGQEVPLTKPFPFVTTFVGEGDG